MRNVVRFFVVSFLLAGTLGAGAAEPAATDPETAQLPRIDKLFADLRRERNEKAAERIANGIRAEWLKSGSPSIDLLMRWSAEATQKKKFDTALDFLDQVVTLEPGFAEGWNHRATVHFMMEEYARSMADIERTLRLEPRHFGALAGMGAILKVTGRKEMALHAFERILEVYPMMRNAQSEVLDLSDELTGQGI